MTRYELQTNKIDGKWCKSDFDGICESLQEKKEFAKTNADAHFNVRYKVVKIVSTETVIYPNLKRRNK